jgi:hypothetical protein
MRLNDAIYALTIFKHLISSLLQNNYKKDIRYNEIMLTPRYIS